MSEGPISRWWASHQPAMVSTAAASSMHLNGARLDDRDRAYCGRHVPATSRTIDMTDVTCSNCLAAARADGMTS